MEQSLIYRNPWIYRAVMKTLYSKRVAAQRLEMISEWIPKDSSVLDVCCGPALLYPFLKNKVKRYQGLDLSLSFVKDAQKRGIPVQRFDLLSDPLPLGFDTLVLQASLYQFIPKHDQVLRKVWEATQGDFILAEPIRNLADSENRFLAFLGKKLTNPGTGDCVHRFNEKTLDQALQFIKKSERKRETIPGGREVVYFFQKEKGRVD